MAPKPILFCSHVVDQGGAETVLLDLLATLDRDRFTPHFACPGAGPLPERVGALEVPVHELAIGGRNAMQKALSLIAAARGMRRLADAIGAKLLYANTMIAGYAGVLAQTRELRCLWHVHIVTDSRIARRAARRAAAVILPSRAAAQALHRDGVDVIENGIAPAFFTAAGGGLRAELGIDATTPLVGIVGRIDPHKGHAVLLRAAAATTPPFHVAIVGDEALAASQPRVRGHTDALRQLATELRIADRVHFLGHRDDVANVLADLDVLAVPSTSAESAPRTIAEAQAAALPIVASRVGGVPEMIRDGITGRLVAPGVVPALGQAIRALLHDASERETMGKAARGHAAAHYSLDAFTRRIEAVLERVHSPTR